MRVSATSVLVIVCEGSYAIFASARDGTTKSIIQRIISWGKNGLEPSVDVLWRKVVEGEAGALFLWRCRSAGLRQGLQGLQGTANQRTGDGGSVLYRAFCT